MWSRAALRSPRLTGHRKAAAFKAFARRYNGQTQGPHPTYFQPPPQAPKTSRSLLRSLLLSTTLIGIGAFAHSWYASMPFLGSDMLALDEDAMPDPDVMYATMWAVSMQEVMALQAPMLDLPVTQMLLDMRAKCSVTPKAVGHVCQLPSNMPCEDTEMSGTFNFFGDMSKDWATWMLCDGHAGPQTAQLVRDLLPSAVVDRLAETNCLTRPYRPNDTQIFRTIHAAFQAVDDDLMQKAAQSAQSEGGDLSETLSALAPALSGSCALMALFDPVNSVLRVANVGDSRAVLGCWDERAGKYVPRPMSVDQTGFNPDEVARLQRDHPGEDVVDPKTGRVHGIMVSRAFGDSRWKWPQELSQRVHDKFWGPRPRPEGMIRTPPYLNPVPSIMETKVRTDGRPDFLILASDGLWDIMSNEDAVTCVEQWLDKFKPTDVLEKENIQDLYGDWLQSVKSGTPTFSDPSASKTRERGKEGDTYFDEKEGVLKWRVSPEHFVFEDYHCGVHLIKNALGGNRRNLFRGVMSVQPPLSREVRDDITVQVVFFGDFKHINPTVSHPPTQ